VYSHRYAKATDRPQNESPKKSFSLATRDSKEPHDANNVYKRNVDNHGIVEVALSVVVGYHLGDVPEHLG
jgi:hypothetical protein